jgi:hypothetical protein
MAADAIADIKKDPYQAARLDKGPTIKKDLYQGNNTSTKVSLVHINRPVVPGIKPY